MKHKFFMYALCVLLVSTFASWTSMIGAAGRPGGGSGWSPRAGMGSSSGSYGGAYGSGYSGHGGGGHK
jgi:hypothetical protein